MGALETLHSRYDVVVVGARAAGAATAMLLARRGLSVLAVDRGAYGSDTLSTHALMRAGVLQLARWDLLPGIEHAGTPAVHRTVFHYADEAVDVPIKPRDGVPALFAPRRTVLDPLLVDAAVEAGAAVRHRVRVSDVLRGASGRVDGVLLTDTDGQARAVRAGTVVGADGVNSTIASLVGAPITRHGRHGTATLYAYWEGLEVDGYHWYFGEGMGAGAIPTNGGQALVFASAVSDAFRADMRQDPLRAYHRVLAAAAPDLAASLRTARLSSTLLGFPGRPGILRRPWGPGWALVGDAANFKDPITAHGLSDALRDAELLASALEHGSDAALAGYEAARDALSTGLFDLSDRIASFQWDTAELKNLHLALSEEMKREVAEMVTWGAGPRDLALAG